MGTFNMLTALSTHESKTEPDLTAFQQRALQNSTGLYLRSKTGQDLLFGVVSNKPIISVNVICKLRCKRYSLRQDG